MHKANQAGILNLGLLLLLCAGIVLGTLLTFKPQIFEPRASSVLSPETSITLQTEQFSYQTGEEFPVTIFIRSDAEPTDYFSSKIAFDENLLEVVKIDLASLDPRFTGKWKWLENEFDNKNGEISLTGTISPSKFQSNRDTSLVPKAHATDNLSIPNVYIDNFLVVECVGCGESYGSVKYRASQGEGVALNALNAEYDRETGVLKIKIPLAEAADKKVSKGGFVQVCESPKNCSLWREIDSKSFAIIKDQNQTAPPSPPNSPSANSAGTSSPELIRGGGFVMAKIIFKAQDTAGAANTTIAVSEHSAVKLSEKSDKNLLNDRKHIQIEVKKTDRPLSSGTELGRMLGNSTRIDLRSWFQKLSIAEINNAVSKLTGSEKEKLAGVAINIIGESGQGQERQAEDVFKNILKQMFSKKELGFYAEILSYTDINVDSTGFFGNCYKVEIPENYVLESGSVNMLRDTLMHEAFHSFNCVNGGPGATDGSSHANPLDEGSAIWITKLVFPQGRTSDELDAGWAETTYGTKNYYRDIGITDYPRDIPLVVAQNPTKKLKDVYGWLASGDPSQLPWNSRNRLQKCYEEYYQGLDRNVDFAFWLKNAANASKIMARDLDCRPLLPL